MLYEGNYCPFERFKEFGKWLFSKLYVKPSFPFLPNIPSDRFGHKTKKFRSKFFCYGMDIIFCYLPLRFAAISWLDSYNCSNIRRWVLHLRTIRPFIHKFWLWWQYNRERVGISNVPVEHIELVVAHCPYSPHNISQWVVIPPTVEHYAPMSKYRTIFDIKIDGYTLIWLSATWTNCENVSRPHIASQTVSAFKYALPSILIPNEYVS